MTYYALRMIDNRDGPPSADGLRGGRDLGPERRDRARRRRLARGRTDAILRIGASLDLDTVLEVVVESARAMQAWPEGTLSHPRPSRQDRTAPMTHPGVGRRPRSIPGYAYTCGSTPTRPIGGR